MDAAGDHGPVVQHVRGGDALELGVRVCERRTAERTRRSLVNGRGSVQVTPRSSLWVSSEEMPRSASLARCTVISSRSPLLTSEQPLAGYRRDPRHALERGFYGCGSVDSAIDELILFARLKDVEAALGP